jgi:hypothetical protein
MKYLFHILLLAISLEGSVFKESVKLETDLKIDGLSIRDWSGISEKYSAIFGDFKSGDTPLVLVPNRDDKELERIGSYKIFGRNDGVFIISNSERGFINGISPFERTISKGKFSYRYIYDYPTVRKRYLHLNLLPNIEISTYKSQLKLAQLHRFNGVVIQLKDKVKFKTNQKWVRKNSFTKSEFKEIVDYAKSLGLDVIPEIKLLTHQNKFIKDKNLLLNKHTYDPRKEEVYDTVFAMIDEIIEVVNPKTIHIGHDEVHGYRNEKQREKVKNKLPHHLFEKNILKVYNYLKSKNIETLMWADMFLSPKRFPEMNEKNLHGDLEFEKILKRVPKDILFADWHYWDRKEFGTVKFLKDNGFKVFGSPWGVKEGIRNFTAEIVKNYEFEDRMMLSTTWVGAIASKREKLQKHGLELFSAEEIIEFNGDIFWNGE